MGGRGSSAVTMSIDEYLGRKGLRSHVSDYMLDKERHPHSLTQRQRDKLVKDASDAARVYSEKRQAAINEYNAKVLSGKIVPKTRVQILIDTANGREENPAVLAARRTLEKRGIDWKTGKRKRKK